MHFEKLVIAMSIDTYGLPFEQYERFFKANVRHAARLYLDACNILSAEGVGNVDFKTALEMYNDAVYTSNDDCRRYQKANNPEAIKESEIFGLTPSREELMEEIRSVNAKVEALVAYLDKLVETTTDGLTKLVD